VSSNRTIPTYNASTAYADIPLPYNLSSSFDSCPLPLSSLYKSRRSPRIKITESNFALQPSGSSLFKQFSIKTFLLDRGAEISPVEQYRPPSTSLSRISHLWRSRKQLLASVSGERPTLSSTFRTQRSVGISRGHKPDFDKRRPHASRLHDFTSNTTP
jgi:hypothetical protein